MRENAQTVQDLVARLRTADADEFAVLKRSLVSDTRVTVVRALEAAERRIEAEQAERQRLARMYEYENELSGGCLVAGLDEVGRGPLAGPLTVAAVVLDVNKPIAGLNDSKQLSAAKREQVASRIRESALGFAIVHIEPDLIDSSGMTQCLRRAFSQALEQVEGAGIGVGRVLLDGNPLHIDPREVNVVHGDAKCASIAAASIIAKVERDALMVSYAKQYPGYGFEENKGYGSAAHQQAIRKLGLCPIHRTSFCTGLLQQSLF